MKFFVTRVTKNNFPGQHFSTKNTVFSFSGVVGHFSSENHIYYNEKMCPG